MHLLDMTAGLKFKENYSWNPFSKMAHLYMGNDAMKVVKNMKFFSHKPGEYYHYDSMTSQILGIIIERATGMPYAQYLSEKVWQWRKMHLSDWTAENTGWQKAMPALQAM